MLAQIFNFDCVVQWCYARFLGSGSTQHWDRADLPANRCQAKFLTYSCMSVTLRPRVKE